MITTTIPETEYLHLKSAKRRKKEKQIEPSTMACHVVFLASKIRQKRITDKFPLKKQKKKTELR